ncbi:MAG TPA: prepilin-type N-terminal cleavage/methylation domain-containing protein [Kofleriaceae bacterium]
MTRTRQRGFTLIELMVALLVSSLLVGMILAIFSRMSLAYRSQQQISGVQQILAAARAAIELDAKQAGFGMPQGFKTAVPLLTNPQSPVQVTNNSNNAGPDQIAFFYADTSTQAVLTQPSPVTLTGAVSFDDVSAFSALMLVVLTTASTASNPLSATSPDIATYDACVLRLATVNVPGKQVTFDTTAPWGTSFAHCTIIVPGRTMMYRFVAHAYRIDTTTPARAQLGALQQSVTGGLLSNVPPGNLEVWKDVAYGFSDLQTAVRLYDRDAPANVDGDDDVNRNWFSGENQGAVTTLTTPPANTALLGMTISLVAHTERNVEGIATTATPNLIALPALGGPPIPDHNSLSDRASTALPTAPPWPDPLLPGQRIYRWTSFQVDFRNLGVGVGL